MTLAAAAEFDALAFAAALKDTKQPPKGMFGFDCVVVTSAGYKSCLEPLIIVPHFLPPKRFGRNKLHQKGHLCSGILSRRRASVIDERNVSTYGGDYDDDVVKDLAVFTEISIGREGERHALFFRSEQQSRHATPPTAVTVI